MYFQTALCLALAVSCFSNVAEGHPEVPNAVVCHKPYDPSAHVDGVKSTHGVPRKDESPYSIALSKNPVAPGESVAITISGKDQEQIRGITLVAKCGGKAVGSFKNSSIKVDLRDCDGVPKSGLLYIDMQRRDIRKAVLVWTAPSEPCEDAKFVAYLMKDGQTSWTQTQPFKVIQP